MHRRLKWGAAIIMVAAVIALGFAPPLQRALLVAVEWCGSSGWIGIVVFGALYTASTLLVVPAAILTAAAGWAWGLVEGSLVVLGVSLVADYLPFALARRLGRERVTAAAKHARTLAAIDEAFRRHGVVLVGLLRLSPIAPWNVTNYLLGLVPVSTVTYLVASTIGSIPSVIIIVYLGTLVPRSDDLANVSLFDEPVVLVGTIALAIASYATVILVARRYLRRLLADGDQPVLATGG